MKGLLLKDFISLKKNVKIFGIFMIIYGFMAFTQKDSSFFSSIFTMLFALLTMTTYSYDEMAKWDGYALTMPVSRANMVQEKYLMMLLLTLIGTIINLTFTIFVNVSLKTGSLFHGTQICLIGASIVILFYCVTIPFITKLGVEKARYIFLAVYLIPFFLVFFVAQELRKKNIRIPEEFVQAYNFTVQHINIILPIVIILGLCISYRISIRIYEKKEF